ncbi:hypothetical protein ACFRNT_14220 [Streptomyces sp. NPDC056697]|uniref:hypothetical protein n=1 Tax=Streptomyces sp. NPDC056697 TaxID=3345915 RepID=UPI0036A2025C
MPTHKMVTIDGVRVRPEDVDRYRARTSAGGDAGPLTRAHADPGTRQEPFDPGAAAVEAVLAHLAGADEAETARVLDAEAAGKNRKSLVEQREHLISQARERADGGGA